MRILLLSLLTTGPFISFSQFVGAKVSYVYDTPVGNVINGGHGFQIGVGGENISFSSSPMTFSSRIQFSFVKPQITNRLDSIEFVLPDSEDNMGFADITFKRFSYGIDFDFGYQREESSIIEPFVAVGSRMTSTNSYLSYDLYYAPACACIDNSPQLFTKTNMLGYVLGLGVKIKSSESFFLDVRLSNIGTWMLRGAENQPLPDPNSFFIDPYGEGRFQNSQDTYLNSLQLEVGIIFKLHFDDSDDDNWYYTSGGARTTHNSSGTTSGSSDDGSFSGGSTPTQSVTTPEPSTPTGGSGNPNNKECTPEVLKPAGRGNG